MGLPVIQAKLGIKRAIKLNLTDKYFVLFYLIVQSIVVRTARVLP